MEEMMRIEDLLQSLQEDGKDATSQFNLRNEDIQNKERTARIPKIKKELKKKTKLLVPAELAIPFNPISGVADEQYNPGKKFRPIMSATKVALMLKDLANRSEATKKAFMSRAGVDTWDTSDVTVLNNDDIAIFKKYRVPVIYTLPVVKIDIAAMTGDFGREYTIDIQRDPITGQFVGDEEPLVLQANRFFRAMAYEEIAAYNEKCEKGIINDTEKVQKETRSKIHGKNPVSDDYPSNWLICMALPLSSDYELDLDGVSYGDLSKDTVRETLGLLKVNKGVKEALANYKGGSWKKFDKYFDFWEIDMACPQEGATPAEIGQGTNYEKPSTPVIESEVYEKINSAFVDYLNDRADVEKIFLSSVRITPYDEKVEKQLATALSSVIDVNSEWLTKEVIKQNSDFLTIALGSAADDLLLECEMDDPGRNAGVLDESKAKESYDLSKMMNEDQVDVEELEVFSGDVE